MLVDEDLARRRDQNCRAHMSAENAHDFARCIAEFAHARYEVVPTGQVFDGPAEVEAMFRAYCDGFPDFHFDVEMMHHAAAAIVVEGTFRGTHRGVWNGIPATG